MSQKGGPDEESFAFGSVMVGRSNHEPPSEIEIKLRSLCQKLRVVERKNLNGAHLMIQKSPQVPMIRCLAVRIYYPDDVKRIDESLANASRPSNADDINTLLEHLHNVEAKKDDVDGLKTFRDKFHSTVVICVTPPGSLQYFDRPDSFLHNVQQTMGNGGSENGKMSWLNFVPDAATALGALAAIVSSFSPQRRGLKEAYFSKQRQENFIPDESGIVAKPEKAAEFAATALSEWAQAYGLPEGEEGVLISSLGTLGAIVTASSGRMDQLPVERATRAKLHQFFGSEGNVDDSFGAPRQNFAAGHVPNSVPPAIEILAGGDQSSMTQQMPSISSRRSFQALNPTGRAYPSAAGFNNPPTHAMDYTSDANFRPRPNLPPTAGGNSNEGFSYRQRHTAPGDMYGRTTSMPPSSGLYGHEQLMMTTGEHYGYGAPGGVYEEHEMMPPPMAYQLQQRQFVSQRRPTHPQDYQNFHYNQASSYEGGFQSTQRQHGMPPPQYSGMHGGFHQQAPPRQHRAPPRHHQAPLHQQQPPMAPNPRSAPYSNKNFRPVRRFH